jgi:hypothetical protein
LNVGISVPSMAAIMPYTKIAMIAATMMRVDFI